MDRRDQMVGGGEDLADITVALSSSWTTGVIDRCHAAQRLGSRLPFPAPQVSIDKDLGAGPDGMSWVEGCVGSQSSALEVRAVDLHQPSINRMAAIQQLDCQG
ncbi:hypothetical protein N826_34310 [Skermanella aerolata KACC 11604]|nr:hypothetical protein N826_34310 [Skermanella aerolata KACC 11604]